MEDDESPEGAESDEADESESTGGGKVKEENATPEEQAEYERAIKALETVMYGNDKTSRAIADQIQPENKIDSVVKASLILLKQLDEKLNLDEVILPQLTQEITDRVVEMGERVKQIEFSDKDLQMIIGAAWEGVMGAYGVDEDSYASLTEGLSDADKKAYEDQYKRILGTAGEGTSETGSAAPMAPPDAAPAGAPAGAV